MKHNAGQIVVKFEPARPAPARARGFDMISALHRSVSNYSLEEWIGMRSQVVELLGVYISEEAEDRGELPRSGTSIIQFPGERLTLFELAAAIGKSRTYVHAMICSGFEMPGEGATLQDARAWLSLNSDFNPCSYDTN